MTRERRRDRQRRELEQQIISEALRRLKEGGPTTVTLRGIATDVGVSAPALYTYFPSLAELFTALIEQSYRSLRAGVVAATDSAAVTDLSRRLAAGPNAYRSWAVEHRHQFNLIFFDRIDGYTAPPGGPTVQAQTDVLIPIAHPYAEARGCTIDDLLTDDDLLDDFLGWWGAFHGIVALEVNHHLDWRHPDKIYNRHLEASIRGLLNSQPKVH